MKIVVTGAAGFIGRKLLHRLAKAGHEVYGVARSSESVQSDSDLQKCGVEWISTDLSNLNTKLLPENADVLFTLAQSKNFRDFPNSSEEVFSVNVSANLKLLNWALSHGVKKVIHASSGGVYGGGSGVVFDEKEEVKASSTLGFYLSTKLCSELVVKSFFGHFDSTVILRPFFVYGPEQSEKMFISRLINSVKNEIPIKMTGTDGLRVNPIFVDDAAACFEASMELDGDHSINVAGPDVLSLREIAELIGSHLDVAPVFEFESGGAVDYVGSVEMASASIGSATTSFKEGISRTINHAKSSKN